jgi:hypothetical protein
MKKNAAARKSSTHFEQIPLDIVKKIAEVDSSKKARAGTGKAVRRGSRPKG